MHVHLALILNLTQEKQLELESGYREYGTISAGFWETEWLSYILSWFLSALGSALAPPHSQKLSSRIPSTGHRGRWPPWLHTGISFRTHSPAPSTSQQPALSNPDTWHLLPRRHHRALHLCPSSSIVLQQLFMLRFVFSKQFYSLQRSKSLDQLGNESGMQEKMLVCLLVFFKLRTHKPEHSSWRAATDRMQLQTVTLTFRAAGTFIWNSIAMCTVRGH